MNLPEKLARELVRVATMRTQWDEMGKRMASLRDGLRPGMTLMALSIEAGCRAAGSPDVEAQMRALADLEGFKND